MRQLHLVTLLLGLAFAAGCGSNNTLTIVMTGESRGELQLSKYKDRDQLYAHLRKVNGDASVQTACGKINRELSSKVLSIAKNFKTCEYTASTDFHWYGKEMVYVPNQDNYVIIDLPKGRIEADVLPTKSSPRHFYVCGAGADKIVWLQLDLVFDLLDKNGNPKRTHC